MKLVSLTQIEGQARGLVLSRHPLCTSVITTVNTVNRVNRVNLTFSDSTLPDWRGPNYPQSFYAARGTHILSASPLYLKNRH